MAGSRIGDRITREPDFFIEASVCRTTARTNIHVAGEDTEYASHRSRERSRRLRA